MADKTGITWCDASWNPTTGCTNVSPGCDHCYAETFSERWRGTPGHYFETGFDVQLRPDKLDLPLRWKKPRRIFVNSMSDLWHDEIPDDYIAQVFAVMALAPHHTFQLLTKRHARMRSLLNDDRFYRRVYDHLVSRDCEWIRDNELAWPLSNLWLGVSAEDQKWADIRIPALLGTAAAIRWVSLEPLLGPVDLLGGVEPGPAISRTGVHTPGGPWGPDEYDYDYQVGIDWVVIGGESGPGARPMEEVWARSLVDQCTEHGIVPFFKQAGSVLAKQWGCTGKGDDPAQWPQEWPQEWPA